MAFGGGNFVQMNKILPGVYTNYITVGIPNSGQTNGTVAGGFVMDFGPDNEVFEITADEFDNHAVDITGYAKDAPQNILFREAFRHADKVVGYKLNSTGSKKAENADVGSAIYGGNAGNNITVTCFRNINNEEKYDVSTYFNGLLKDVQTVGEGAVAAVEVQKGTDKKGTSIPEELQNTTVTFTTDGNTVTATYTGLPEGYTPKTQLKLGSVVTALQKGRIELEDGKDKQTITFYPDAPNKAAYTFVARVQKDDDKSYATLATYEFNIVLDEKSEVGADASALKDNSFVAFKTTGIIPENAGLVFEGGASAPAVTAQAHNDMIAALENRAFNVLFCDVTDSDVKELYLAFNKRMREERGVYFQVVFNDFVEADYEGAISVNNKVITDNMPDVVNPSSLVVWTAGYSSAIDLKEELTNKPYDGELEIDVSTPDVQNEMLIQNGHFLFHKVSMDEIYTLIDVNSFVSFTDDKNHELQNNKVVRVVDYVHNKMAYDLNRNEIGRTLATKNGRDLIWAKFVEELQRLNGEGVIENFNQSDVVVNAVPGDKWSVEVVQRIMVAGTVRYIYVRTYIHENLNSEA